MWACVAVLSAPFYLNYISYGDDWKKYYETEPSNFTGGEAATAKGLVGGVEACFWSEFIDATNFIARAWPRTMSIGERGWSSISEPGDERTKWRGGGGGDGIGHHGGGGGRGPMCLWLC